MLVLFDHGTPKGLARALSGHTIETAQANGWDTLSHGALLNAAEEARFELLLTHYELACWAEGILSMAANRAHQEMLELLIRFGARVPDFTKWGRAYHFKHYDIAAFLLERGMNPNHMNWHRTTLLHDMAWEGDVRKAGLLMEYGADINCVDDEFRSTPLGVAARWGRREVVRLLLDRGADPNRSGASWAIPLAWALKKGHSEIAADLRSAGAR